MGAVDSGGGKPGFLVCERYRRVVGPFQCTAQGLRSGSGYQSRQLSVADS